jgi:tetratricopeptide (TPR) repeat protein
LAGGGRSGLLDSFSEWTKNFFETAFSSAHWAEGAPLAVKPPVTGSSHRLPFEQLAPLDFERLCLWLVGREGWERAEHLGEAGSEGGRDVVAWKGGRRFVFQCKRVRAFTAAHAREEIAKLRALPVGEQPQELVFVVSRAVRADTRRAARVAWGDEATCHFWVGSELDERVKRHPELLREFFQLPDERPAGFRHNLPYPSLGGLFQGREEVLGQLRERLEQAPAGRATAIAGKAVHGLGGVGKTRLAVEYAWRHAAGYSAALFVGAGSPVDLRRNLAAVCGPGVLDLPEQAATEEEVREMAVRRWLLDNPGWLLILDNVDSEEAAVAVDGLVGSLAGGHVLLTGRLARWGAEVEPLELDVLGEEAAVDFLLARTAGRRRATKEDGALAGVLALELGFLPLALEQAGAYIAERRLTFAGYLAEWRERREVVLGWFDPRVSHYPVSVAVTWQTSVDRLSATARRLLQRLAWLGPELIPESLLEVPVPELSEPEPDPRESLVQLATYSLVTRAAEAPTFTVHRLVQDVTRRSLERVGEGGPLVEALRWVNDAFVGDPQDVRDWPILDLLAPHAGAVVAFADKAGITAHNSRLMNQLALLFEAKALYREAEPLMRRALALVEESIGPEHPDVAIHMNNLAVLLRATNRLVEAEGLMRSALKIDEKSFGSEHFHVARDLSNLALLLKETNRVEEAEALMLRALGIDENSFGPDHSNVALHLNNLALLLKNANRLAEAEQLILRSVAIWESSLGEQHPKVATALNNLALLLCDADRWEEAEPLMRRALAIEEKSFGPDHPAVSRALNNLAQLLQATDRLPEAEPLIRRALAIGEKSFGPDHPEIAIRLNNLAQLLQATNRLSEAEPMMRRHLVIFLNFTCSTGHAHPHLQTAFANYRLLLEEMGKSPAEIEASIAALEKPSGSTRATPGR